MKYKIPMKVIVNVRVEGEVELEIESCSLTGAEITAYTVSQNPRTINENKIVSFRLSDNQLTLMDKFIESVKERGGVVEAILLEEKKTQ